MSKEIKTIQVEDFQLENTVEPIIQEQILESAPIEVEEVVVAAPEVKKVKEEVNKFKVIQIVQKRPSTYCLNVEGKGQVIVHKSKFDRVSMTVEL